MGTEIEYMLENGVVQDQYTANKIYDFSREKFSCEF